MNEHDATELAFKNGYKQGTVDAVRKMQEKFTMHFGTYTPKDEVKISGVFRLLGKFAEEMLEGKDEE